MIRLVPVLEVYAPQLQLCTLWPVRLPAERLAHMRLEPGMDAEQIGSVVWTLSVRASGRADEELPGTVAEAISALLDEEPSDDMGGLLVQDDSTGAVIPPGCCCDLSEWRAWLGLVTEQPVYSGHSPSPVVDYSGKLIRVWQADDNTDEPVAGSVDIEFPRGDVTGMLLGAQANLMGFLDCLRDWAVVIAPQQSAELIAAVDTKLEISAPLVLD